MQRTGRMTHGGSDFVQRFWETAAGFVGALDVDGMMPGGARWEQWVRIRLLHTMIRLGVLRSGVWDLQRSMPISQSATAAGAHIFGRYRVNTIRALGGHVSHEEAFGFALMWRWISRLQGANAELLGATSDQEFQIQHRIHAHLYAPDETSRRTTAAMLDGIAGHGSFPVHLPRRVHAAFSRRLLHQRVVQTLPGRDVPGDLGIPLDPAASAVVGAAVASLRAADTVARLRSVRRLFDRYGQRLLDREVAIGLRHRTPDFQPGTR